MLSILNDKGSHGRSYKDDARAYLGVSKFVLPDSSPLIDDGGFYAPACEQYVFSITGTLPLDQTDPNVTSLLYTASLSLLLLHIADSVWQSHVVNERGPDFSVEINTKKLDEIKAQFSAVFLDALEQLGVETPSVPVLSVASGSVNADMADRPDPAL